MRWLCLGTVRLTSEYDSGSQVSLFVLRLVDTELIYCPAVPRMENLVLHVEPVNVSRSSKVEEKVLWLDEGFWDVILGCGMAGAGELLLPDFSSYC